MAEVIGFRGLRYRSDELAEVVAPPYDVIGPSERAALGARSPHNVVHLDLPEGDGDGRYANAANLLADWRKSGALTRDEAPRIYVYTQVFEPPTGGAKVTRRGFLALVRAEPYSARVVLPHERTLSGPKEDRYKLFRATSTALSPVFFLYRDASGEVKRVLDGARGITSFRTADGIDHAFAAVEDGALLEKVKKALADSTMLIADGHHRYETTLRYGEEVEKERTAAGKDTNPRGAHRYVLAFLCDADDPGLVVFPTHRIVHGLDGFDRRAMLEKAAATFDVKKTRADDARAMVQELAKAGEGAPSVAAVFPDGEAAILSLRSDVDLAKHAVLGQKPPVLRRADVVVLHGAILEPLLGITPEKQAAQTNLGYSKNAVEAVAQIRRGEGDVLFLMNPTPVETVRQSCEAGEVMPQKSTYFYPKVVTGLVMHLLDPEEIL